LLENRFYEEFLSGFNATFFKNMNDNIEEMFFWFLNLLKKNKICNEMIVKFIILFKQNLIVQMKKKNPSFSKESYFRKIIEENLDLTKINIKETFNDLELDENFETQDFLIKVLTENQKKIAQIEDDAQKNIQNLKEKNQELEEKIEKIIKNNKESNEKIKNLENNQEASMNSLIFLKDNQKSIQSVLSFFYDGFFPFNQNNMYLELANSNKTIIKKVNQQNVNCGWIGVYCERSHKILDKLSFSVKVEFVQGNGPKEGFLLGFCLKTAPLPFASGYHRTPSSFMLKVQNGNFFDRSKETEYLRINSWRPNDIYSSILNIKEKTIAFLLNGLILGSPKNIDLKEEEIDLMCPCVDIYDQGIKLTLIDMDLNVKAFPNLSLEKSNLFNETFSIFSKK